MGNCLSLRSRIVATMIRPNKLLYRLVKPSAKTVRRYIHPQKLTSGGKVLSPFGVKITRSNYGGVPSVVFKPKTTQSQNSVIIFLHGGGYVFGSS